MITWKLSVYQDTWAASHTGVSSSTARKAGHGRKIASAASAAAARGTAATMARTAAVSVTPAGVCACAVAMLKVASNATAASPRASGQSLLSLPVPDDGAFGRAYPALSALE